MPDDVIETELGEDGVLVVTALTSVIAPTVVSGENGTVMYYTLILTYLILSYLISLHLAFYLQALYSLKSMSMGTSRI